MSDATGHVYLTKANNDLVSHCRCVNALATFPPQMDCPWCGCGWLFNCVECRKAFTFARGVIVPEPSWRTAERDLTSRGGNKLEAIDIITWIGAIRALTADVKVGREYVYLDGRFLPADAGPLRFAGWHSDHDLPSVPQAAALVEPWLLNAVLTNREYWGRTARQRP